MHTLLRGILPWLCLLVGAVACWGIPTSPPISTLTIRALKAEPGDTVIRLSWNPVPGAAGYFVFRDNRSTPLNPTPVAEARFEDIGLTNGRTYTYTVAPVDQAGRMGAPSAPIQAAPKSP